MNKKSNYKTKFKGKRGMNSKDQETKSDDYKERPNDPSWYIVNGQLAKDVASFSFNTATGAPVTLGTRGGTSNYSFTVPGIMTIYTSPSVGYSWSGDSPVNMAAKNLYSFIRHANSGHSNYDSPDLMMYILAMDSVYSWYATMCRLYGVLRVYSQLNRYFGDNLITALGFYPADMAGHIADLRYHINQFAVKMSSFATPVTMSIYRRHVWMYGNYFSDSQDAKGQLYAYVPATLWKFNEYEGAGRLEAFHVCSSMGTNSIIPKTNLTWQDILNISATLINPMVASEDMNIMSGDILKAYGDSVWKMDMIPEDYTVMPIYSPEILSQIHNTHFVGGIPFTDGFDIAALNVYQDTSVETGGNILFTPLFRTGEAQASDKILDMYKQDVTPEDSLVATRNMVHGTWGIRTIGGTKFGVFEPLAIGTEVCLGFGILSINPNSASPQMAIYGFDRGVILDSNTALLNALSKFNQHPILYTSATDAGTLSNLFGEMNNYTVLDYQDIYDLHSSAIMSELALPMLGVTAK